MRLYSLATESLPGTDAGLKAGVVAGFFRGSLLDYLRERGRDIPAPLQNGKDPAIRKGSHGKPYLCEPGLEGVFFSLSHTRGHVIVCFAESIIGADCENARARPGIEARCGKVAARCFADDERRWLELADVDDAADDTDAAGRTNTDKVALVSRFFEIWTAKEAYMKYTGNGFSEGFRSFSVLDLPLDVSLETGRLEGTPHIIYSVCTTREPD